MNVEHIRGVTKQAVAQLLDIDALIEKVMKWAEEEAGKAHSWLILSQTNQDRVVPAWVWDHLYHQGRNEVRLEFLDRLSDLGFTTEYISHSDWSISCQLKISW